MKHLCHAHGCEREVPPEMFACPRHWRGLPAKVRSAILREYRRGQERDKNPSARYMAVQQYAVGLTAFRPNDEEAARQAAPFITASEVWRRIAIDDDAGDPLADVVSTPPAIPAGHVEQGWNLVKHLRLEAARSAGPSA